MPDVVEVFRRHLNLLQRILWRKDYVFQTPALIIEYYVEHFTILTIIFGRGDGYILPVGVLLASLLELGFLVGKFLDDFFRRNALGLGGLERAFLGMNPHRQQEKAG